MWLFVGAAAWQGFSGHVLVGRVERLGARVMVSSNFAAAMRARGGRLRCWTAALGETATVRCNVPSWNWSNQLITWPLLMDHCASQLSRSWGLRHPPAPPCHRPPRPLPPAAARQPPQTQPFPAGGRAGQVARWVSAPKDIADMAGRGSHVLKTPPPKNTHALAASRVSGQSEWAE